MVTAVALLYNLALVAGTAYLVFWRGESAWCFLLTLLFMANVRSRR